MRKAFSLLELMIVIIILGLLASFVLPNVLGQGEEAKRKLVCVQMNSIEESLKMFKADNGSYPSTEEGLKALTSNPDAEKYPNYAKSAYMKKLPKDSWGNAFVYINNGSDIELISLGSDRKEGGSDDKEDIRFSQCER